MPNINQMKNPSKFLTKEDCGEKGILLTIDKVSQQNMSQGGPPEMKWILHFKEQCKPMVLNQRNIKAIARITGKTDTEDWTGQKIVCYNDPNVEFGGDIVGGIRVRAPKQSAQPKQQRPAQRQAPNDGGQGPDEPYDSVPAGMEDY